MKNFLISLTVLVITVCPCVASSQAINLLDRFIIPLNVAVIQNGTPTEPVIPEMPPRPRTPIPEISYDEHSLYFITPCISDTLQLVDEDSNVVYSIVITDEEVNLPTTLTGTYELQIIHDNLCFYGDIEL